MHNDIMLVCIFPTSFSNEVGSSGTDGIIFFMSSFVKTFGYDSFVTVVNIPAKSPNIGIFPATTANG